MPYLLEMCYFPRCPVPHSLLIHICKLGSKWKDLSPFFCSYSHDHVHSCQAVGAAFRHNHYTGSCQGSSDPAKTSGSGQADDHPTSGSPTMSHEGFNPLLTGASNFHPSFRQQWVTVTRSLGHPSAAPQVQPPILPPSEVTSRAQPSRQAQGGGRWQSRSLHKGGGHTDGGG